MKKDKCVKKKNGQNKKIYALCNKLRISIENIRRILLIRKWEKVYELIRGRTEIIKG